MSVDFAILRGYSVSDTILPVISVPYKYHRIDNPNRYNRRVYRFDNGYGLSVIPDGRRPLDVECFIVRFYGTDINDYELDYGSITSRGGLCPWLLSSYNGIQRLLGHIRDMNSAGQYDNAPPDNLYNYSIDDIPHDVGIFDQTIMEVLSQ